MKIRNWKQYFSPHILGRGEEYYYDGAVEDLRETENGWEAVVHGSEDYEVEISIDGGIPHMYCSCPYAEGGENCKHMAAVMFKLENPETSVGITEESSQESLSDILDRMDADTLRKELEAILNKDYDLRSFFFQKHRITPVSVSEIRSFKRSLQDIALEVGDGYGFVGWNDGEEYVERFTDLVNAYVQPMIRRGEYMSAFNALKGAFDVVNTVEMDGSSGEHSELGNLILGYWEEIIAEASPSEKDDMYGWFAALLENNDDMILQDDAEYAMTHFFDDEKYVLPLLEKTRKRLNQPDLSDYEIETLLSDWQEYLEKLHLPEDELQQWIAAHRDLDPVREYLMNRAEKSGNTEELISLLKENLKKHKIEWKKVSSCERLRDIYHDHGDTENEKKYLSELILTYNKDRYEEVKALRSLCTEEEWKNYREQICSRHKLLKPTLYFEDQLYDQLIKILPEYSIGTADTYRYILQKLYPDEYTEIYGKYLDHLILRHPCASLYTEMKQYLEYLTETEPGKERFAVLMKEWPQMYPTRKSLVKTLNEVNDKLKPRSV